MLTGIDFEKFYKIALIIILIYAFMRITKALLNRIYNNKTIKSHASHELLGYLLGYSSYILGIVLILGVFELDFKTIMDFLQNKTGPFMYIVIALRIVIIFTITRITVKVLNVAIQSFFEKQKKSRFGLDEKKADTLSELLKNTLRYVLYPVALLMILGETGLDIKSLMALTGAVGVAVGFGAQSFIKDVIAGFLILFEDQFAVGDYVAIDGMSGIVETIGLRITKVKDASGDLYIIPNGSIVRVTNKSRSDMRALVEVDISYSENIDKVIEVIKEVNEGIKKDFAQVVEGPNVIGVTKFSETGYTIRVQAITESMKQFPVELELRKRIKEALDKEGIEMSHIRRYIIDYGKGEKSGN